MYNRYKKTPKIVNGSLLYSDIFNEKKVDFINQYSTYDFNNLKFLEESNLEYVIHIMQSFDKLYMLSQKYYNSPEYGWLILYTNRLGSEFQISVGQALNIYLPLQGLLGLL